MVEDTDEGSVVAVSEVGFGSGSGSASGSPVEAPSSKIPLTIL